MPLAFTGRVQSGLKAMMIFTARSYSSRSTLGVPAADRERRMLLGGSDIPRSYEELHAR
jgi:hypothetical protein